MCGFTGTWNQRNETTVERCLNSLSHRGPDAQQSVHTPLFSVGHCRLAVIAPDATGKQPMWDTDKRFLLAFNGEIYNYRALRVELRNLGHAFHTQTDTEVLLYALKQWGHEAISKLNGCFAFAFFDAIRNTVLLARDQAGIKPLYYMKDGDVLHFSSELKALPITSRPAINKQALGHFLQFTYTSASETIYEGVFKLKAGHYLELPTAEAPLPWFKLKQSFTAPPAPFRLDALLESAVQDRLIADVPLGSFLSGGMDSSIVAALASKNVQRLNTFSIGFSGKEFLDETEDAKRVADHIGSNHHSFHLNLTDLEEHVSLFFEALDEPFADSSSIAVSYLSAQTKKHVTVALSGDGADELFGGYRKHQAHAFAASLKGQIIPSGLGKLIPGTSSREDRRGNLKRQLERFDQAKRLNEKDRYYYLARFSEKKNVLSTVTFPLQELEYPSLEDQLNNVLLQDQLRVLPCDMLHKVDLMSMHHALEVRTPFLDKRVIYYANALPSAQKFNKKEGKLPLRKAFQSLLPEFVFEKKKHGFEIPLESLLRGPLLSKIEGLKSADVFSSELFNIAAINGYLNAFLDGQNEHTTLVWSLLVYAEWDRKETARFESLKTRKE